MKTLILSLSTFTIAILMAFSFNSIDSPGSVLQISPGSGWGFQDGQKVLEIYTPPRPANAKTYKEYWYISKDYVYPSFQSKADLLIKPVETVYANLQAFRQQMKAQWPAGRMIVVTAMEE